MEYVLFLLMMVTYISVSNISSKIEKIEKSMPDNLKNKKDFPSLEKLVGKNIEILINEIVFFDNETKGILKEFNDKWLVLESTTSKNKKELCYHRLSNIMSINVIN